MSSFSRARKPEHKQLRREAVLRAARQLSIEGGPRSLTLNELGRRSKVSKPNIYRYFESLEDVLVTLCLQELTTFVRELESALSSVKPTTEAFATVMARAYAGRGLMCQLLSMLAPVLEHNLSFDRLRVVRRELCALTIQAASMLAQRIPELAPRALWLVQTTSAYVASLWPAAHPAETAASVLALEEFAPFRPQFEDELRLFLRTVLVGLRASTTEVSDGRKRRRFPTVRAAKPKKLEPEQD